MDDRKACEGGVCTCGGSCGCGGGKDPHAASTEAVWHDPTIYNLAEHGPSYLPAVPAKTAIKTAAYYDTTRGVTGEPLGVLLGALRAGAFLHQTHHWRARGSQYYGDHLMFERLYNESQEFIDQIAEKAVGTGSESDLDAAAQADWVALLIREACVKLPEDLVLRSLAFEKYILSLIESVIQRMRESGSLTPGVSNLLEGAHDKHEQFVYLLGQRSQSYQYDRT